MSKSNAIARRGFILKNSAIALLLIAAAIGSAAMVAQAQSSSAIEVRITAQRLEDGRTEFAIEQREGDGWRGRLAPRARFLPAEPPVDRWLFSTPVTIAATVEQPQGGGEVEVRITAMRLEDGRTEFALQQREGDGWSDRIAPRARFLPAEPPVGRWLFSTPVSIAAPAAGVLSLDEYLSHCSSSELALLADDATWGDFSSALVAEMARWEALTPPAELTEWHSLNIEAARTIQAVVDMQPQDDVIEFAGILLVLAAAADLEAKINEAASRLPDDIRLQMAQAGCIDPEGAPDDHGNDIDGATIVAVGAPAVGAVNYGGDSDFFRFTAEEGQFYQIDVALGTLSDSQLELQDSNGWGLASNDDHGDSPASRIIWKAPASGDYYLVASGYGAATGSYTLTVSHSTIVDDHGNDIDGATTATVGAPVEGAVDYEGDPDFFRFTAEEGQLYQIDVALGTLSDSQLELQDSNGWGLASNDDHGDSPASRIIWKAPASGDYYLVASGYGAATGSYTLTVSHSTIVDDHGDDIDGATTATVGAPVEGVVDYEGDSDYFRFTAEEGQLYQIDVALGTLPDSRLTLLDSDGWGLASNDDRRDSPASRIIWKVPASGDYYLAVGGYGAATGSYTLTVSTIVDDHGDDIADATTAAVGAPVEGVVDYEGDSDYFRFTAEEGQLYQIDVALGTLSDSRLELQDSDGWGLASNDDHGDSLASRIIWKAPVSGDYYLAVEATGWGDQVGSYTLTVTRR